MRLRGTLACGWLARCALAVAAALAVEGRVGSEKGAEATAAGATTAPPATSAGIRPSPTVQGEGPAQEDGSGSSDKKVDPEKLKEAFGKMKEKKEKAAEALMDKKEQLKKAFAKANLAKKLPKMPPTTTGKVPPKKAGLFKGKKVDGDSSLRRRQPPGKPGAGATKKLFGEKPFPKKPLPKKLGGKASHDSHKKRGLPKDKVATIVFANEAEGAEDVDIYWIKPPESFWPPLPARKNDVAKLVTCRIGRRSGKKVSSIAELKDDLEVRAEFNITVRRDWSPSGAKHFLNLVQEKFFDGSCLFRAVPNFLVQFGVSSDTELQQKFGQKKLTDDPPRSDLLPLRRGTLAYAGSGPNSRTTQLWLALKDDVAGKEPWETPVGYVQPGHGLEVLDQINTEYGDLAAFQGGAPDPRSIEGESGFEYLLGGWPNIDYFESCSLVGDAEEEPPKRPERETVHVGTVKAGQQLTQKTQVGHEFVAKTKVNGEEKELRRLRIAKPKEVVQLAPSSTEL